MKWLSYSRIQKHNFCNQKHKSISQLEVRTLLKIILKKIQIFKILQIKCMVVSEMDRILQLKI